MTEEFSGIPEAPQAPETFEGTPEKKNNKTLWIILGIVAALLLCCCLVVGALMSFGVIGGLADYVHHITPLMGLV